MNKLSMLLILAAVRGDSPDANKRLRTGLNTVEYVSVPFDPEINGFDNQVGVYTEEVMVSIPKDYNENADTKYPMVLSLHGYGGEPVEHREHFGLGSSKAYNEGSRFIEVFPQGREGLPTNAKKPELRWRYWSAWAPAWTGDCGGEVLVDNFEKCGDSDVTYLRRVVEFVAATYRVDKDRIYVYGHSNGAGMSMRLACDAADIFAAAVSIEGAPPQPGKVPTIENYECNPSEPIGILHIGGTEDKSVFYKGDETPETYYPGAADSIKYMAKRVGCQNPDLPEIAGKTYAAPAISDVKRMDITHISGFETEEYNIHQTHQCPEGIKVTLWKMNGATHAPEMNLNYQATVADWLLHHDKSKKPEIPRPCDSATDSDKCGDLERLGCEWSFVTRSCVWRPRNDGGDTEEEPQRGCNKAENSRQCRRLEEFGCEWRRESCVWRGMPKEDEAVPEEPRDPCNLVEDLTKCLIAEGCVWERESDTCVSGEPESEFDQERAVGVSTVVSVISTILPIVMKIVKHFMGSLEAGRLTNEQIQEIIQMVIKILKDLLGAMESGRNFDPQVIIKLILEIIKSIIGGM